MRKVTQWVQVICNFIAFVCPLLLIGMGAFDSWINVFLAVLASINILDFAFSIKQIIRLYNKGSNE